MMVINQEQVRCYFEDGFIVMEDFFTPAQIDALTERIDIFDEITNRDLREKGRMRVSIPDQIVFSTHLHGKDARILEFIAQEKLIELATSLIGPNVRLYYNQAVYKRPENRRDFPWHQDNGYTPTDPAHYLTVWLALTDATLENGCIWVQPHSHTQGVLKHTSTDVGLQCYFGDNPGLAVPLRKGSLVAFQSLMVHRSTPNLSDHIRKAFIIQYSPVGFKNAITGVEFDNGPVLALEGQKISS
jgi:phytanoyl-CoA hydroxylase